MVSDTSLGSKYDPLGPKAAYASISNSGKEEVELVNNYLGVKERDLLNLSPVIILALPKPISASKVV
jgi:hypothetical protein